MVQTEPLENLIALAAGLRAAGERWDEIAKKVKRSAGRVRDWPRWYPEVWARHYRAAETRLFADITVEARHHLIGLMRSEDERIKLRAVIDTLKLRGMDRDREFALEAATAKEPDSEFEKLIQEMQRMTEEKAAEDSQQDPARLAEKLGEPAPEGCTVDVRGEAAEAAAEPLLASGDQKTRSGHSFTSQS